MYMEQFLDLFFHSFNIFEDYKPVILNSDSFNWGLSGVSSLVDLCYTLLAGILEKWRYVILSASYLGKQFQ